MRPGHFHMGLDIKTNGRTGFPVHAAADGYISRVKIESVGFGNAIYINHPNGYTTVYVHLDHFTPALEAYVKEQQYKLERWEVLLDIPPDLFPVRQGQVIAASGNTGGSMAPHLHFEIRDTHADENRNPFLFGLPIVDNLPPVLSRVGVYDGDQSVYLQVPRLYPLAPASGVYTVPGHEVVTHATKVRLAIGAVDLQTGSANKLGIYSATVFVDGKPVNGFTLDRFGYDLTRYVNAHTDYSLKTGGGPSLEFLSPLPGDLLPIYHPASEDGLVHLNDDEPHPVRIEVKDAAGNTSVAAFTLRREGPAPVNDQGDLFLPNQVNVFENDEFLLYLPEHALYDAVRPVFQNLGSTAAEPGSVPLSPVYSVLASSIPVEDSFTVSIRPPATLPDQETGKYVIFETGARAHHVSRVTWSKGWASARLKDLGEFRLLRDDTPPEIRPLGWTDGAQLSRRGVLSVAVKDNLGSVNGFRAELDGKWLMFSYKGDVYTYHFDAHFPPGEHVLTLSVYDEAGNLTRRTYHVSR
ncbi:M23 family metallopeptidase [Dinghuibacter silviterrae]|uniref:M23 family metallopeptidase n=1 Tax=Dinghuibacter silviterrae TaxID=1539049 RepID=UPI0013C31D09|nr:M23 family metallopeptidase [Dinghuibacter silviterrae]